MLVSCNLPCAERATSVDENKANVFLKSMDLFPLTANMQSKLCDRTVVRLANDVFQYASDCADREKASAFDILIASLWMTYYGSHNSAAKNANVRRKSEAGSEKNGDIDREADEEPLSNGENKLVVSSLQEQENVSPKSNEGSDIEMSEDNDQSSNHIESSIRVPVLPKQHAGDETGVKTNVNDDKISNMEDVTSLVEQRSLDSSQSESNAKKDEFKVDIPTDNIKETVDKTETVKQDSQNSKDVEKEMNANNGNGDNASAESEVKETVNEQEDLDKTFSEPKELGMECEDDNNADGQDDVTDHSMIGIQITNVTGGVDVLNSMNEVKIKTELPDGLIIEINEDDNEYNSTDEEGCKQYADDISVGLFDEKKKRDHVTQQVDNIKTSNQMSIFAHESNLKPVMMMSNVHNSQDTQTTVTRFGPLVSVQTASSQQQFQEHQTILLENPQFSQQIIPQKQVAMLRHPHHQHGLSSILPQGSGTVQGGLQDQTSLLSSSQFDCQAPVHPAFCNLSSGFMTSLTKESQSKFVAGNKVDFAALDSVIQQILQFYPFFQEKVADLCMQLLGQNYYLFSLYKSWKDQNRGTDSCQWSINDASSVVGISSVPDFEISMENVADDSCMETDVHLTSSAMNSPEVKYMSPFHSRNILGCTVKRNLSQRTGTGLQTSFNAIILPNSHQVPKNASVFASENRLEYSDVGHTKGNNVVYVHPIRGAGNCESIILPQNKKGRVQCATVTSSEVKNRLKTTVLKSKQPTDTDVKKKRKKRDPSVPPRPLHPNSLKNLKQNRDKQIPELVAAQTNARMIAARLQKQKQSSIKKQVVKVKNRSKEKKKLKKVVTTIVDKKPVVKPAKKPVGYKQLAELQRHAGDMKNIGSTERGAKVKAQKKLNVYNEIINKSSEADLPLVPKDE